LAQNSFVVKSVPAISRALQKVQKAKFSIHILKAFAPADGLYRSEETAKNINITKDVPSNHKYGIY
jgi:hypothetical protein